MAKNKTKKVSPIYTSYIFLTSYNNAYHYFLYNNLRGHFFPGIVPIVPMNIYSFNIAYLLDMHYNINNSSTTVMFYKTLTNIEIKFFKELC